jgi:arylsulfatase A-like enzyme
VDGKVYGYEPPLKVPLVCRGPGIPENETRDQLVNNLDLTATILDWAEATPGRVAHGRSLLPVIADASAVALCPVL